MNLSLLYQGSRAQLLNQLVYFDEEKMNFLDQYFPEHNSKRNSVEQMLTKYSGYLEHILSDLTAEKLNSVALIGSQLEIRYLDDDMDDTFTIVFPNQADPNENKISFLSPLGFQLLMAKRNEIASLDVPSGQISIQIKEIKYVNSGNLTE